MKTPVIILSGFLGSGKTTLLLELIKQAYGRQLKPAILMNELGKADVDGRILAEATKDVPLEKLFDGCICCSKKSEITGSLEGLLALAPDVIIVELTGVANPEEVVDAMSEPGLLDKVRLHRIVTVIDGENALDYNSIFASDKQLVHTLRRQMSVADLILLNKTDLISPAQLTKVTQIIRKHNDSASIYHTVQAKIEGDFILEGLLPLQLSARSTSRLKVVSAPHQHHHSSPSAAHIQGNEQAHQHNASFSRIQSIYLPVIQSTAFSLRELGKFLKAQGSQVLRAKGYLPVSSSGNVTLIQYVGKQLRYESSTYRGPHYLVVIGYELDEQKLLTQWSALKG
ncbi:CobW family GTP-binding protein [Paenibacillus sanguinis]|uniref:CobW family GTP-binding protein n=1 Tax=Paenibacillus sanguinis TaxID=225906 RepID=UPI00036F740D|nr:GTP-binding protein [Paenibacillus sanguinis]